MNVYAVWIIFTLAAYRGQRVVTADTWPPMMWVRRKIGGETGERMERNLYKFLRCAWCYGTWFVLGAGVLTHLFAVSLLTGAIRNSWAFAFMVMAAAASIVGWIGEHWDP